MRILAGKAKGMKLQIPKNGVRPTTKKAREALFSILSSKVEGAEILDLFSGSGSLGIESLSRGACSCTFVEKNLQTIISLKLNLSNFESSSFRIIKKDVRQISQNLSGKFDIIFADPPYQDCENFSLNYLFDEVSSLLSDEGVFILEKPKREKIQNFTLVLKKEKIYGDSSFLFFEK